VKNVENINTRIKDTAGVIKPLDWWSSTSISHPERPVEVKSIQYRSPTTLNTTGCGPVIFQFLNSRHQPAGDTLFVPGQTSQACVDFHNETVVGYAFDFAATCSHRGFRWDFRFGVRARTVKMYPHFIHRYAKLSILQRE
jgi:hypothetical protein